MLEVIKVDETTHTAIIKFDPETTSVEEIKALINGWDQPGEKFNLKGFKYLNEK